MPWHTSGVLWEIGFIHSLKGWDEELANMQDWDMHIRAVLEGKNNYLKSTDLLQNIDSFYRKGADHDCISNSGSHLSRINKAKIAVTKCVKLIANINDPSLKLELAKSVFMFSQNLFYETNKIEADSFLKTNLTALGSSKLFCMAWNIYLYYRYDITYPKVLRKLLDILPFIYQDRSLNKRNSTYLTAKYDS